MPRKRPAKAGRWIVTLLAVLGLALLGAGIGLRTIWLPDSSYTATAQIPPNTPVVVTAPGVPEMMSGQVQVHAEGSPEQTIVVARGREEDVRAWLGRGARATITGLSAEHRFAVGSTSGEQELPSVSGSDLWVDQVASQGSVNYTYRPTTGRYQLVFGVAEGAGAPTRITFTWPTAVVTPWALPLMIAGGVLLLLALVLGIRAFSRARRAAADEVAGSLRPKVSLVKAGREPAPAAATGAGGATAVGASDDTVEYEVEPREPEAAPQDDPQHDTVQYEVQPGETRPAPEPDRGPDTEQYQALEDHTQVFHTDPETRELPSTGGDAEPDGGADRT